MEHPNASAIMSWWGGVYGHNSSMNAKSWVVAAEFLVGWILHLNNRMTLPYPSLSACAGPHDVSTTQQYVNMHFGTQNAFFSKIHVWIKTPCQNKKPTTQQYVNMCFGSKHAVDMHFFQYTESIKKRMLARTNRPNFCLPSTTTTFACWWAHFDDFACSEVGCTATTLLWMLSHE